MKTETLLRLFRCEAPCPRWNWWYKSNMGGNGVVFERRATILVKESKESIAFRWLWFSIFLRIANFWWWSMVMVPWFSQSLDLVAVSLLERSYIIHGLFMFLFQQDANNGMSVKEAGIFLHSPKTNKAPENRPGPKKKPVFQPSVFRCYVSFREGIFFFGWHRFMWLSCVLGAKLPPFRTWSIWIDGKDAQQGGSIGGIWSVKLSQMVHGSLERCKNKMWMPIACWWWWWRKLWCFILLLLLVIYYMHSSYSSCSSDSSHHSRSNCDTYCSYSND